MSPPELDWIVPDWPAPARVRAVATTRRGGVSQGGYAGLNLALHVGDDEAAVRENRRRLRTALSLPGEPCWLEQVHGSRVVPAVAGERADGAFTTRSGQVCAVLTADCLPVLLCDRGGDWVAAVHAGWRGLAAGVLEQAVARWPGEAAELLAWLGPAIGAAQFEVGDEVRQAMLAGDAGAGEAFRPSRQPGRWLADLYALARRRLLGSGVAAVYGGGYCTYRESGRFFSYRRDGACGRMASLIWLHD